MYNRITTLENDNAEFCKQRDELKDEGKSRIKLVGSLSFLVINGVSPGINL